MRFRVIFLFAILICRQCCDGFIFGIINAITGAARHRQITNRLNDIQNGINIHRAETKQNFGIVNTKLDNLDSKLNVQHRQTQLRFLEVFTAIGNLDDNIAEGRKEAQDNFKRTTAQLTKLQGTIDDNHKDVLENFAVSFDLFYYIGSNLNMVSTNVMTILELISSKRENDQYLSSEIVLLNDNTQKLKDRFAKIDHSFTNFLEYSKDVLSFNNHTLINYAMASLAHDGDSPMLLLKDMHDILLRDDGLLFSFAKPGVGDYLVCSKSKTPQQLLFSLYEMVIFAELKAILLMSFSFDLKEYFGKGSFANERIKEVDSCISRLNKLGDGVEAILKISKSHLWVCDSPSQPIGTHFIEFTNFIQGNIVYNKNSVDQKRCDGLTQHNSLGSDDTACASNLFSQSHVCKGTVYGCTSQNKTILEVCLADAPKRYDNVKLSWGTRYGEDNACRKKVNLLPSCGYCLCYCDAHDSPEQDRYISLDASVSDHMNEKVVTGIRFTKNYDTLHLQVQEADLGPLGMINSSSASWVPVSGDSINQKFTLTRLKNSIDIDIFEGEPGHVLTGVRFREIGYGVTLEVRLTPYNPETGIFNPYKSVWKNNMNKKNARNKINVDNVKPPTAAKVVPVVRSTTNQYIEVTTTGMVEDVAQTVVPFFDSRAVKPSTLVPLSGFGLQYKSSGDRYGGYIAPVLVTLNYANHVDKNIPIPKLEQNQFLRIASSSSISIKRSKWDFYICLFTVLYTFIMLPNQ